MKKEFPEECKDAVGLTIRLKENASKDLINIYGIEKYIIDVTKKNMDLLNTPRWEGSISLFTWEDMLRVKPINSDQCHVLLMGLGAYKRIKQHFNIVQ
jgi:hypothetical protein